MALTDPELDLLRDFLQDDPTDEVFLQVGAELVRRQEWVEAEQVLRAGLEAHPDEQEGWELLARAAMECGHHDLALTALPRFDTDPARQPANARLEIEILERAGLRGDAAGRIEAYLAVHPDDAAVRALRDRLAAPPVLARRRGADPFDTPERAESYVTIGRVDRALRVYRRLLYHHPDDARIVARLRELAAARTVRLPDLAEELGDPGLAPAELRMAGPGEAYASAPGEAYGITPGEQYAELRASGRSEVRASLPDDLDDPEDEDTDPDGGRRRRRRSLLQR